MLFGACRFSNLCIDVLIVLHLSHVVLCSPLSYCMQTSSDYDHLMLMQKVEVFEQAIEHTSGDDLAKVLWLKSPSSEVYDVLCNI